MFSLKLCCDTRGLSDVGHTDGPDSAAQRSLPARMRDLPRQTFRDNPAAPDYEQIARTLQRCRRFEQGGVVILPSRQPVFHMMRPEQEGVRYERDVFRLSVAPEQIQDSWDALRGLIFSPDSPFAEWKLTNVSHRNLLPDSPESKEGQLTLLGRPSGGEDYSVAELCRMRDFVEVCETLLQQKGIRPGDSPAGDIRGANWRFTSYHNSEIDQRRMSAVQKQSLQQDFVRLIAD